MEDTVKTRILIVDDHRGYNDKLKMLIDLRADMDGLGETET
jgi:hypothetical protein